MSKEYEIVSHTQLKYVTAFLVRLEERMLHIHRDLELGIVLEGSVTLKIQQQSYSIGEKDVYLVNPFEPHEFISEGGGTLLITIQISPQLTEGISSDIASIQYQCNPNLRTQLGAESVPYQLLCALCIEFAYSYLSQLPDFETKCFSLVSTLLYLLRKSLPWEELNANQYDSTNQKANRIINITDYIDQNFQRKLLLGEIAERENLSLTYLSHLFKEVLGIPFQEYLNQKRFEYACGLLFTTNQKILDISIGSGFSDVRYFNEMFFKQYGCYPKLYRKGINLTTNREYPLSGNTQFFLKPKDAMLLLEPLRKTCRTQLKDYPFMDFFS